MNAIHFFLVILLCAVPALAQQRVETSTNHEVAALIEGTCPAIGMSEDEVLERWGKPTAVNSPGRHFLNPPEGFSHWSYRSSYRGEKLDGPAMTEDAFRLIVYFIHGRVVGSELESRKDVVGYAAHISCSTSGISSTFSPPTTAVNAAANTGQQPPTLVSVLRDYREAWKAGHDSNTPWKAHFVMNRCPASLTPRLVAEAFRFPGQLEMADARGTDQRLARGTQPLWSAAFAGYSNTFARTHIFGYHQGTFATPELEHQYETALQRLQTTASASNWFLQFELPGKVRGYIRTGFGGCMLIASAPLSGLDLMLSIDLPNGDAGPFCSDTPATHEYYGSVHDNPVELLRTAFPVILDGLTKKAQPSGGAYGSPAAGSPSAHP